MIIALNTRFRIADPDLRFRISNPDMRFRIVDQTTFKSAYPDSKLYPHMHTQNYLSESNTHYLQFLQITHTAFISTNIILDHNSTRTSL